MTIEDTSEKLDHWVDDLLDRKRYADFLTNYVDAKVAATGPGMVLALDAPWGLGKTFFISRWAEELRSTHHAAIVFDAWKNDSAEDPVVSFMAALKASLNPLIEKLPANTALGVDIQTKQVVRNLRKATLSAAKVVGTAVVKKLTGVAADEVIDAFSNSDAAQSGQDTPEEKDILDKGLDAFFEKTLESHTERLQAVIDFRESLQQLLNTLREADLMKGPLYVFIDELDRCRPNYAISLLEGIKHIFSVEGVAFVISTNLDQLSKAVGAIYGPSFDGPNYLKRFFDFEFELPQPTRINFIHSKMTGTALAKIDAYSGLDTRLQSEAEPLGPAQAFSTVSEAMRLDLRSLNRVLVSVEAIVANIPSGQPVACLWLFFLTALRYKSSRDFEKLTTQTMAHADFYKLCNAHFTGPTAVKGASFDKDSNGWSSRQVVADYDLQGALWVFYSSTVQPVEVTMRAIRNINAYEEPYTTFLLTTLQDRWKLTTGRPHPIREYANLISMAGHVI